MDTNMIQQTKTCGWCQAVMVDESAELRQEIEQLEAIVNGLNKRVNLAEWNAARVAEQLEAAAESAAYWRGRCLAAESELAQIKRRLDCNGLADVAALPFGD